MMVHNLAIHYLTTSLSVCSSSIYMSLSHCTVNFSLRPINRLLTTHSYWTTYGKQFSTLGVDFFFIPPFESTFELCYLFVQDKSLA